MIPRSTRNCTASNAILMSPAPLIITTLANERFAPGLGVMVCSALLWAEQKSVVFYVVDGGILPHTREKIVRNAASIARQQGIEVDFHFLDFERMELPSVPLMNGSLITYARLLLPKLLQASSVYYVDADIVCNRPFIPLEEMESGYSSCLVAACQDPCFSKLQDEYPGGVQLSEEEQQLPYVNAGFMWMNLAAMRECRFWESYLELITSGVTMRYADQTAINYLCRHRIHLLPEDFNRLFGKIAWDDLDIGANFHFVFAWKPWMDECGAKSFVARTVFSSVARDFGFIDDVAAANHSTKMPASLLMGCYLKLALYRLIGSRHAARQKHILASLRWLKSSFPAYEARQALRLRNPGQPNISP